MGNSNRKITKFIHIFITELLRLEDSVVGEWILVKLLCCDVCWRNKVGSSTYKMKVTVCFEGVCVIVPCGNGDLTVRDLIQRSISRYRKATNKASVNSLWFVFHALLSIWDFEASGISNNNLEVFKILSTIDLPRGFTFMLIWISFNNDPIYSLVSLHSQIFPILLPARFTHKIVHWSFVRFPLVCDELFDSFVSKGSDGNFDVSNR